MRPLVTTYMDRAGEDASPGVYSDELSITLDRSSRPLVDARGAETQTFVVKEPADDDRIWAFETLTKVMNEPSDDERAHALETETRVVNEPADDDRMSAESLAVSAFSGDDCATGLVSF